MCRLPAEMVAAALDWVERCADLRRAGAASRTWRRALADLDASAELRYRNPFGHLDGLWEVDGLWDVSCTHGPTGQLLELDLSAPDLPRARQAGTWDERRPTRCVAGYRTAQDDGAAVRRLREWYEAHGEAGSGAGMARRADRALRTPGLWHRLKETHPMERLRDAAWLRDVYGHPGAMLVVMISGLEVALSPAGAPPPASTALPATRGDATVGARLRLQPPGKAAMYWATVTSVGPEGVGLRWDDDAGVAECVMGAPDFAAREKVWAAAHADPGAPPAAAAGGGAPGGGGGAAPPLHRQVSAVMAACPTRALLSGGDGTGDLVQLRRPRWGGDGAAPRRFAAVAPADELLV